MPQTKHHSLQEHWKCPASTASKSSAADCHISFCVACNMSITQGHCLGGRAAHSFSRDHQQDFPVDHFAVQEVKRAKLFHGVPTRSQHAPSPPLHTECRAKPPSEQGHQHRPPRAVLVTFHLQFLIAALDPRLLNSLNYIHTLRLVVTLKRAIPNCYLEWCHCSTWHCTCRSLDLLWQGSAPQLWSAQAEAQEEILSSHLSWHSSPHSHMLYHGRQSSNSTNQLYFLLGVLCPFLEEHFRLLRDLLSLVQLNLNQYNRWSSQIWIFQQHDFFNKPLTKVILEVESSKLKYPFTY